MKASFAEVEFMAKALEAAVKQNPYLFVPGSGDAAGEFGLNYFNIVHAVIGIQTVMNEPDKWVKI